VAPPADRPTRGCFSGLERPRSRRAREGFWSRRWPRAFQPQGGAVACPSNASRNMTRTAKATLRAMAGALPASANSHDRQSTPFVFSGSIVATPLVGGHRRAQPRWTRRRPNCVRRALRRGPLNIEPRPRIAWVRTPKEDPAKGSSQCPRPSENPFRATGPPPRCAWAPQLSASRPPSKARPRRPTAFEGPAAGGPSIP